MGKEMSGERRMDRELNGRERGMDRKRGKGIDRKTEGERIG